MGCSGNKQTEVPRFLWWIYLSKFSIFISCLLACPVLHPLWSCGSFETCVQTIWNFMHWKASVLSFLVSKLILVTCLWSSECRSDAVWLLRLKIWKASELLLGFLRVLALEEASTRWECLRPCCKVLVLASQPTALAELLAQRYSAPTATHLSGLLGPSEACNFHLTATAGETTTATAHISLSWMLDLHYHEQNSMVGVLCAFIMEYCVIWQ